jgi:hypothetical protein
VLVEMKQAFQRGDKARLSALLPQARGHALEPWAAYWELKARLQEAAPNEVQDFFARYPGSYQEDRLRNDWLLLWASAATGTTSPTSVARFRMNDDVQVRCYAVLVRHVCAPARATRPWPTRCAATGSASAAPTTAALWPRPTTHGRRNRLTTATTPGARRAWRWNTTGRRWRAAAIEHCLARRAAAARGAERQPDQVSDGARTSWLAQVGARSWWCWR